MEKCMCLIETISIQLNPFKYVSQISVHENMSKVTQHLQKQPRGYHLKEVRQQEQIQ